MLRELWTVSPPMRVCDCSYNLQNHLTRGEQHHYRNLNSNISTWFVHAFEWCNSVSWSAVEKEKRITNLNFSRGKFQSGKIARKITWKIASVSWRGGLFSCRSWTCWMQFETIAFASGSNLNSSISLESVITFREKNSYIYNPHMHSE